MRKQMTPIRNQRRDRINGLCSLSQVCLYNRMVTCCQEPIESLISPYFCLRVGKVSNFSQKSTQICVHIPNAYQVPGMMLGAENAMRDKDTVAAFKVPTRKGEKPRAPC